MNTEITDNKNKNYYNPIIEMMANNRIFKDKIEQLTHKFKKNSLVYRQGEKSFNIYFLISGKVHIGIYVNEKETITSVIKCGELFGENALTNNDVFSDYAITTEASQIAIIPINIWNEISTQFPELTLFLIQLILNRKKEVQTRLESVIYKDTKTRILDFILKCLDERGEKIDDHYVIPEMLTHQAIANWVSTSRQTVTIFINDLKEKSIIDFDRKKLTILDLEKLKAQYI